ncbi:MAG: Ig-like domain-containing protein [Candidatus Marinimicrobia bacterium]|nr:Ig-like domain-containing protein [Candidatus Neomarinimicrobiota bacterium]
MKKYYKNNLIIIILTFIATSCLLIMPDLEAPEIEIISPAHGDVLFEIVEINCSIEDNSNLDRAQLWVNNDSTSTSIFINELKESYSMFWNTTNIEDGTYYLEVRAYDKNGNIGKSDEITIHVDNTNSYPQESPIISVNLIDNVYQITWQRTDATDFKKYKLQHLYPWIDILHYDKVDIYQTFDQDDTVYYRTNIDATQEDNYYRVIVYDTLGFEKPGLPKYVPPDPFPNEVLVISAEYDNNSIIIQWEESFDTDFLRYELYESYDENMDEHEMIFTSNSSESQEYTRVGIYDNETRYYRVDVIDIWEQKTEGPIKSANAFTRFYKTFGGGTDDEGYHVLPLGEMGFIVSGYSESSGMGMEDGLFLKVDSEGKELEYLTFGGGSRDILVQSIILQDSTIAMIGRTESSGEGRSDGWLLITDLNGNILNEQTYGGAEKDRFTSIVEKNNGNLAVMGSSESFENGASELWLMELDHTGNMLNEFRYGGADFEYGRDLYSIPIGGYLLLGETRSYGSGGFDIWLVKVNEDGEEEWNKTLAGTGGQDYARKLLVDNDGGGYFILGKEGNNSSSPICFIKVDLDGNEIWRNNYGYTSSDDVVDMVYLSENSDEILIMGTTYKNGNGDLWLLKVNLESNGAIEFENIFEDGLLDEHGYGINVVSEDGGFILTGETSSYGSGGKDILLIKTDPYGNTVGYEGN